MKPAVTPHPRRSFEAGEQTAPHLKLVEAPVQKPRKGPSAKSKARSHEPYEAEADVDDMWDNVPV